MSVVSGSTRKIIKTIPVPQFPGAVAVNPQTNTVYALTNDGDTVTMING